MFDFLKCFPLRYSFILITDELWGFSTSTNTWLIGIWRFMISLFRAAFCLLKRILSLLSYPIYILSAFISSLIYGLNYFSTSCISLGLCSSYLILKTYWWFSSLSCLISLLRLFTKAMYCYSWPLRYVIL